MNEVRLAGKMMWDGRVTKTQNGNFMCLFTLNVSRPPRHSTENDKAFFDTVPCVAWGVPAEIIGALKKDETVAFFGYVSQRKWTDKAGQKQSRTQVIVEELDKENMEVPTSFTSAEFK